MFEAPVRQAAILLLESAIRLAPPGVRHWGEAIRGELNYVEGPWAGAMWALGGASVMLKQAVVALVVPGPGGTALVPDGGLFAKNIFFRRAALTAGCACVLAALLFFAAPPFRQAFRVALEPASAMAPGIEDLARRAESQHDPQGIAFAALRVQNPREGARLAAEAVSLDANLTWIYAILGARNPARPEVGAWLTELRRWDPQNALFELIAAEAAAPHASPGSARPSATPTSAQENAWRNAMAAAFAAPKFDDYLGRVSELNRRVAARYELDNPYEVEQPLDLPGYVAESYQRYALLVLSRGADLGSKGDWPGARAQYWSVARFGQTLDARGSTAFEHQMGATLQSLAYTRLRLAAVASGDREEAALFGYLAEKFAPGNAERPGPPGVTAFGRSTARRNAAVVEISGLMMVVFAGLALVAAALAIAGSRRRARPGARRAQPVAVIVVLASGLGLLFSAVTLYLTYRPYWYILQSAFRAGGTSPDHDLVEFLAAAKIPRVQVLFESLLYAGSPSFLFYVWTGVTLLAVSGLILILLRRFTGRPRASPP
jgi:hypothetical protein